MSLLKIRKVIFEPDAFNMTDSVNILLCSDRNVIRGLGVTIVSILENIKQQCSVHIAFNGELPLEEEKRFEQLALRYRAAIYIYWINDDVLKTLNSNSYITITAYYRLLMPYVLKEFDVRKCLYLDTDTLCIHDFTKWYEQLLGSNVAAVTKDATSQPYMREKVTCHKLGMSGLQYFNSGILLININEYVKEDIGYKAVNLCAQQKFGEMDQDVLNILLEEHVVFDDSYAYNCGMSVRNYEIPDCIYLIHFTGAKKPWKLCTSLLGDNTISLFDKHSWKYHYYAVWRKYAEISPWKEVPFDLPKNYREWRYLANMYFKSGRFLLAIRYYKKYISCKRKKHKN